MLAGAFFSGVSLMTKRPHWGLSGDEQEQLGEAVAGVMPTISPQAAKALQSASPWVRLALVTGTIISSRVAMDAGGARPPLRPVPTPQQQPRSQQQQPPQQTRRVMPDVVFPTPPTAQPHQTAADAAADLPAIFRGEVPSQSPIIGMTTGGGGIPPQHTAPAFDVPGLEGGDMPVSAILDTRVSGNGENGNHTAPLPEVPGVTA